MRKMIFGFCGLMIFTLLDGQSATDVAGSHMQNNFYSASYAVGEIISITLGNMNSSQKGTCGVIQPDPLIITLNDDPLKQKIVIFPNPSRLKLFIDGSNKPERIELYDLTGQCLQIFNGIHQSIDVAGYAPGCYILKVFTADYPSGYTVRFVKE